MTPEEWEELERRVRRLEAHIGPYEGDDLAPTPQGRTKELEQLVVLNEKRFDTKNSPLWKRIWDRINGWPTWSIVAKAPKPRFWHKWTGV